MAAEDPQPSSIWWSLLVTPFTGLFFAPSATSPPTGTNAEAGSPSSGTKRRRKTTSKKRLTVRPSIEASGIVTEEFELSAVVSPMFTRDGDEGKGERGEGAPDGTSRARSLPFPLQKSLSFDPSLSPDASETRPSSPPRIGARPAESSHKLPERPASGSPRSPSPVSGVGDRWAAYPGPSWSPSGQDSLRAAQGGDGGEAKTDGTSARGQTSTSLVSFFRAQSSLTQNEEAQL